MSLSKPFTRAALLAALVAGTAGAAWSQISVPGTADPWLAGMPPGTNASIDDFAPGQSPVLVTGIIGGTGYQFLVTGSVSNTPFPSGYTPDGASFYWHSTGAENGIAQIGAPINSLLGVFLTSSPPNLFPAPSGLDFSALGLNVVVLHPALQQPFFIGDGVTNTAQIQTFFAPAGATRLFLGPMDGYEWNNNSGSFAVTVRALSGAVPEPSTYGWVAAVLLAGLIAWRRRRTS